MGRAYAVRPYERSAFPEDYVMKVQTPTTILGVRGTSFAVKVEQ